MTEPERLAQVFDWAIQRQNKILTRFRGGFEWHEVGAAIVVVVLLTYLFGYNPGFLPGLYLLFADRLIRAKRRIKTDYRPFLSWLWDLTRYHLRARPFWPRRIASGRPYYPRPSAWVKLVIPTFRRGA